MQPLNLKAGITIDDITLIILEIPRDNDQDVPLTDPDPLFDRALDPAHAGNAVKTPDTDMVCAHHQLGAPELFTNAFLGQPYPDDLIAGFGPMGFFHQTRKSLSFHTGLVRYAYFFEGRKIYFLRVR